MPGSIENTANHTLLNINIKLLILKYYLLILVLSNTPPYTSTGQTAAGGEGTFTADGRAS